MGRIRTLDKKTSKYHNHAVIIDGMRFASKGEAERYIELRDMKLKREIIDFERQPKFVLLDKFKKPDADGKIIKYPAIKYYADFRVTHLDGQQTVEDVKGKGGYTTPDFRIKQKLFESKFTTLHLVIVQRTGKGIEAFDETPKTGSDMTGIKREKASETMRDVPERVSAHYTVK
jgi:hypothetical protein